MRGIVAARLPRGPRASVPLLLLGAIAWVGLVRPAHALPTQVASFLETDNGGFVWTNNGNTGATFMSGNGPTGVPVTFSFQNLSGVPAGPIAAHAFLTSSTFQDGFDAGGQVNQPLSGQLTLSIIRDSDHTNLLTAIVSPAAHEAVVSGQAGSASLNSSTPGENITFTSDYATFANPKLNALGLTFSGINPSLSFNTSNGRSILNSFSSTGVGSFSFDTSVVPEPASLALLGIGGVLVIGARRRLSRR